MISTTDLSLKFSGRTLFDDVNIKFSPGNCYGLIGANGAGKSTFLKILSGEIEPSTGSVNKGAKLRLSFLKQDHFAYDEYSVLDTVIMGNTHLYEVMIEKNTLYAKPDFSDADGIRAGELEEAFAEMNGYEAESEACILLSGLGIPEEANSKKMAELESSLKVKVLLAQALFGQPDILLLDEPTNHLDIQAIRWLEEFLFNFENTVIVVSHDRYFMNQVCTHIADIDYAKITTYTGNYEFWRQSSALKLQLKQDQNKKNQNKADELKKFIARFSANASKSKQATSRRKQLEKLQFEDLPVSSRRYPFIGFTPKREAGNDILTVENLEYTTEDQKVIFENLNFSVKKGDKIAFVGKSDVVKTALFDILSGEKKPTQGDIKWGITITHSYFPSDNSSYFDENNDNLIDWLRQYSTEKDESFIRGFLGKMLFSREEALKKTSVLSGGERVRCMLSKLMLSGANVLILDQPTAHLDLESISALNDGLKRFDGTVLFCSEDHEFIQTIADRIIHLDKTLIDDQYSTYDEFIDRSLNSPS